MAETEVLPQNACLLSCDNVTLPSGTKVSRTYYPLHSKGTYTPNNRVPHSENILFTVATVKISNPTQLTSVCNARMLFNWQVMSLFTVMEGSEMLIATHQHLHVLAHYMTGFYSPYLKKVLEILFFFGTHAHIHTHHIWQTCCSMNVKMTSVKQVDRKWLQQLSYKIMLIYLTDVMQCTKHLLVSMFWKQDPNKGRRRIWWTF